MLGKAGWAGPSACCPQPLGLWRQHACHDDHDDNHEYAETGRSFQTLCAARWGRSHRLQARLRLSFSCLSQHTHRAHVHTIYADTHTYTNTRIPHTHSAHTCTPQPGRSGFRGGARRETAGRSWGLVMVGAGGGPGPGTAPRCGRAVWAWWLHCPLPDSVTEPLLCPDHQVLLVNRLSGSSDRTLDGGTFSMCPFHRRGG